MHPKRFSVADDPIQATRRGLTLGPAADGLDLAVRGRLAVGLGGGARATVAELALLALVAHSARLGALRRRLLCSGSIIRYYVAIDRLINLLLGLLAHWRSLQCLRCFLIRGSWIRFPPRA